MQLSDYLKRLLGIASAVHRWAGAISELDERRRERIAVYADRIAETLSRAADALARLEQTPGDRAARRQAARELGRIEGYVGTLVHVLRHHLDGRKLHGVKRRLEQLGSSGLAEEAGGRAARLRIGRVSAAEGYFRALADALRT
jgi:hypothetical protein